ncbi:MAG: AmmeMemoRadiSam system protein B, partial [Clostridiales bacterium]
ESTALDCLHYDEKAFAVNLAQAKAYPRQGKIIAATLPHYPPVMNLTASVLATVQDYPYQKIIVLGPNHTAQGPALIIGAQGWKTPLGKINGCFSQGRELLNKKDLAPIGIFDQRMTEDHSIAVQMPYIKHYFPQTPVLSILISRAATLGQLQSLAETIYRWQEKEDILVLASIDFSHDQDYQKALDNDQKTKYAVEKKDINSLNLLKGDFLDSPQSLITLICLGQYYNQNLQLWQEFIQRGLPPLSQQGYTYLIYNLQDK